MDVGVAASNRKALEAVVAAGHRREQSFSYAQEEAAGKHDPLLQARKNTDFEKTFTRHKMA